MEKVVNTFIKAEFRERGRGVRFFYPVERFSNNNILYVSRPAGLRKWNFDFKVNVTPDMGLEKGTHEDIASRFKEMKSANGEGFKELISAIDDICNGREADIDEILRKHIGLPSLFQNIVDIEILLKVLKWMFIMEDIVYWNYDGRMKLYNYLKEI